MLFPPTGYDWELQLCHFPVGECSLVWFGVVWCVWPQVSYHTGSHAGLPAAEPRHGGGDWHLRWREGNGARLGDVGVRGTVVDVIGAAKQNKNTSRYKKGVELAYSYSHRKISSKLLD